MISELHSACTPCRFASRLSLTPPVLHYHVNHAHLTLSMWDEEFKTTCLTVEVETLPGCSERTKQQFHSCLVLVIPLLCSHLVMALQA